MRKRRVSTGLPFLLLAALVLTACSNPTEQQGAGGTGAADGQIRVVATTTLVGDVVRAVGGDHIHLTVLIPPGVDEHAYEPTAREVAIASDSSLIFVNGAGLEPFLERMMSSAGGTARLVAVSEGIHLIEGSPEDGVKAQGGEKGDPHVWTDPMNVLTWVGNIEKALKEADPANAGVYEKNASTYREELKSLDGWIKEQVSQVPPGKRLLVTDHMVFTYFAERYGFEQVGAIVPGYSTAAAPSAQELAALEDAIRKMDVPVIFVGSTVNQDLAARVTQDTGTRLVEVLTGSLTPPDGPAPSYLEYMRYNVNAIVAALK